MRRHIILISAILFLFAVGGKAQTYTFDFVCDYIPFGPTCPTCPPYDSTLFNGVIISVNGAKRFYLAEGQYRLYFTGNVAYFRDVNGRMIVQVPRSNTGYITDQAFRDAMNRCAEIAGDQWGSQSVVSNPSLFSGNGTTATPLTIVAGGITSTEILNGTILAADLNQMGASTGQVLKWNGTAWAPAADNNSGGTVTSVGLSLPSIFSVSGSPVTGSGTLTATLTSQSANLVLASPNGSTGAPTFRALVAADIPTTGGDVSGLINNIQLGTGVVGATELASTSVTAGSYGSATQVGAFTVDADGRLTAASSVSISGLLPSGGLGQTLRHDGTAWIANSFLHNTGSAVGINTSSPSFPLEITGNAAFSDMPTSAGMQGLMWKNNYGGHLRTFSSAIMEELYLPLPFWPFRDINVYAPAFNTSTGISDTVKVFRFSAQRGNYSFTNMGAAAFYSSDGASEKRMDLLGSTSALPSVLRFGEVNGGSLNKSRSEISAVYNGDYSSCLDFSSARPGNIAYSEGNNLTVMQMADMGAYRIVQMPVGGVFIVGSNNGIYTSVPAIFSAYGDGTTSAGFTAQFHNSTRTSNSLVIRNDGFVGVNTGNPAYTLDVTGTFRATSRTGTATALAGWASDNKSTDVPLGFGLSIVSGALTPADNSATNEIQTLSWSSPNLSISGGNSVALPVLPSGANGNTLRHNGSTWEANNLLYNDGTYIGINTAGPTERLDIEGSARIRGHIRIPSGGISSYFAPAIVYQTVFSSNGYYQYGSGWNITDMSLPSWRFDMASHNSTDANEFTIIYRPAYATSSDWTRKMVVKPNGSLGVNMASGDPARTLHVVGGMRVDDLFTDVPNKIVGADTEGDFGALSLATGLSIVSGALTPADNSATNEIQTLSWSSPNLSISGGNSVALPVLPSGTATQTLRHDGTAWIANSFLRNTGSAIIIGTNSLPYVLNVSGNAGFETTTGGTNAYVGVQHTSNTANSNSIFQAVVAGGSAGDPVIQYSVSGEETWATGIDNSDGNKFKVSRSVLPGTNDLLTIETDGDIGIGTATPGANSLFITGPNASSRTGVRIATSTAHLNNIFYVQDLSATEIAKFYIHTGGENELHLVGNYGDFVVESTSGDTRLMRGDNQVIVSSAGPIKFNNVEGVRISSVAADPSSPTSAQIWYNNSGDGAFKYRNDVSVNRTLANVEDDIKGSGSTIITATTHTLGTTAYEYVTKYDALSNNITVTCDGTMREGFTYWVKCRRNATNSITFNAGSGYTFSIDLDSSLSPTTFAPSAHETIQLKRIGTVIEIDR